MFPNLKFRVPFFEICSLNGNIFFQFRERVPFIENMFPFLKFLVPYVIEKYIFNLGNTFPKLKKCSPIKRMFPAELKYQEFSDTCLVFDARGGSPWQPQETNQPVIKPNRTANNKRQTLIRRVNILENLKVGKVFYKVINNKAMVTVICTVIVILISVLHKCHVVTRFL